MSMKLVTHTRALHLMQEELGTVDSHSHSPVWGSGKGFQSM